MVTGIGIGISTVFPKSAPGGGGGGAYAVDWLVLAGGGGGGSRRGSGGGAGGLRTSFGSTSGGGASSSLTSLLKACPTQIHIRSAKYTQLLHVVSEGTARGIMTAMHNQ